MNELEIVYRDEYLVAINKPSGLLVHRSMIDRHETRFALQLLRDQIGQHVYPVHRLDKPTSGVLLFALSPEIARTLSAAFADQQVEKTYLAVVRGHPPETGRIDHPLKDKFDKLADRNKNPERPARAATSLYRRLATIELPVAVDRYPQTRYALVEVQPKTGRKHQIRRHLKHIGHPIIGDAKHGKGVHNRFFQQHYQVGRLLLASTRLAIRHPLTRQALLIKAPLDRDFMRIVNAFNWQKACVSAPADSAASPRREK